MKLMRTYLLFLLTAIVAVLPVHAQTVNLSGQEGDAQGQEVSVRLVTIYPGADLYEIYGHTELRVIDPYATNPSAADLCYNYGVFDFNAPNFVFRFVRGETDYLCCAFYTNMAMGEYRGTQRRVVEQELNLTPEQALAVRDLLRENSRMENATYRYKFVSDNCATRPRDIIEKALNGSLKYHPTESCRVTFRDLMRKYNANYSWERFGIDLALGGSLDTVITYRQQMFVPMVLMDAFDHATIDSCGVQKPLVKRKIIIQDGPETGDIEAPTPTLLTPMCFAIALLLIVLLLSVWDYRRGKVTRWFDSMLFAVVGIWGCVMFFLIFISTHEATSPNLNGLWLHPFYFIPAVLIWVKKWQKTLVLCHAIIVIELVLTFLAWVLLNQVANAAFFPLMLVLLVRSMSCILVLKKKTKEENNKNNHKK